MAKRRARGAPRELTRAELIALERRSAGAVAPVEPTVTNAVDTVAEPVSTRRGVLPSRSSRVVATPMTLTRAQEMAYVRSDLRRLTILAGLMLAILAVLALVLR